MISLNDEQKKILEHDGNLLITGGPGTGKTTVAIVKAKVEIENLQEYEKVLFLSFSNSAIHQIKTTSQINLNSIGLNNIQICTYHSFCFNILESFGGLLKIKTPIRVYPPEEAAIVSAKYNFSSKKELEQHFRNCTFSDGRICFDLFAVLVAKLLKKSEQVLSLLQTTYRVVIVDEFQDTDNEQWEMLKLLGKRSKLICLADPDQRIYDFRPGISKDRLLHFETKFKPQKIELKINHRNNDNQILNFANSILTKENPPKVPQVYFHSYRYFRQAGGVLKTCVLKMQKNLKNHKKIRYPQICILARTNQMANQVSRYISKKTKTYNFNIRHEILLDENKVIFSQKILCELLQYDGANKQKSICDILNEIANLHFCQSTKSQQKGAQRILQWKSVIEGGQYPKRSKIYTVLNGILDNIPSLLTGDVLNDTFKILTLLKRQKDKYMKSIVSILEFSNPFTVYGELTKKINAVFQDKSYKNAKALFESYYATKHLFDFYRYKANTVVMTMHKSKGREFDAVILFDAPHGGALHLQKDDPGSSRRLIRVAITRARHNVAIIHEENNVPNFFKSAIPEPLLTSGVMKG